MGRVAVDIFASDLGCDFLVRANLEAAFVTRHSFESRTILVVESVASSESTSGAENIGAAPAARRKRWLAPSLRPPRAGRGHIDNPIHDVALRQHQAATHVDLRNHGRKAGETNTRGQTSHSAGGQQHVPPACDQPPVYHVCRKRRKGRLIFPEKHGPIETCRRW